MLTVNDLLAALQDIADEHGDLPIAVTVQPNYPLAGNVQTVRVTERQGEAPKLHFCAETTEYGPTFHEGDDEQHIETVLQ